MMPSGQDKAKDLAVTAALSAAKLGVGLVCPSCLAALPAYDAALVLKIVYNLNTYLQADNWNEVAYEVGQIAKKLQSLIKSVLVEEESLKEDT